MKALDGIDLEIARGEVFGLLGRNGSGKTTTVRVLTTLTPLTSGHAEVFGMSVVERPAAIRRRIGATMQDAALDPGMTGREHLLLAARLWGMSRRHARSQADDLLERFGLTEVAGRQIRDVLRRDAAPPGHRHRASQRPVGAVPGRAHRRARPAEPPRAVGGDPEAESRTRSSARRPSCKGVEVDLDPKREASIYSVAFVADAQNAKLARLGTRLFSAVISRDLATRVRRPVGEPDAARESRGASSLFSAPRIVSRCRPVRRRISRDRQAAHEVQPPDLRPLLHSDHPGPP